MTHTREVRAVEIGERGFAAVGFAILREQGHVWLKRAKENVSLVYTVLT